MFEKKQSIFQRLTFTGLMFLLILSLSTVAFPQRTDDGEEKKITLEKDKRINGYKIIEYDNGKFKVKILGATNPLTGKKLNGKHSFAYRCQLVASLILVTIIIAKGRAEQKLGCGFRDDPYLYY